jgi:hypothetical protein
MAYVTDKDYKRLAEAAADDLMRDGTSLNDSIAKLASSMELSEDQTRRLCEASNNVTFNKLFKARDQNKTASDHLVEFDVADYKKVLGNQIKSAEQEDTVEKTASLYELRSLDDGMYSRRGRPEEELAPTTKVAFELRRESVERPEITARTVRKTVEHLSHEKLATELEYHDTLATLRNRFRKISGVQPFAAFEKDAAVAFGPSAEMHLNELLGAIKLPEVTYDIGLLTKRAGFVDDTTEEMLLLSKLIKTAERVSAISKGIKKLEASL